MSKYTAFANRLRKNRKHIDKWARRQGLSCYRYYDRDLPEFPLAIDRYDDQFHVQEFKSRWEPEQAEYDDWLQQTEQVLMEVLEASSAQLHYKLRERQKGISQYQKTGNAGEDFTVEENGLQLWVNLDAYLDTGLFLDHRITRQMVRERARGKSFLNLYAYTGSFSVYAAAGGARSSVTVDLSKTYQAWTARNFALNRLDTRMHKLHQGDVVEFLQQAIRHADHYDLIVMDPPSFSNSKRMKDTLDVQRDHAGLIEQCMQLLNPDGELFFSNNKRGFKLAEEITERYPVRDITRQTLPEDFKARGAHRCWLITRPA